MIKQWRDKVGTIMLPLAFLGMITTIIFLSNANTALKRQVDLLQGRLDSTSSVSDELKKSVEQLTKDSQADHDAQLQYLRCIVNLFGLRPGKALTQAELDACLEGTRLSSMINRTEQQPETQTPEAEQQPQSPAPDEQPIPPQPPSVGESITNLLQSIPLIGGLFD